MCHKRLVHAIETCGILCSKVMVTFADSTVYSCGYVAVNYKLLGEPYRPHGCG